ncbi:MAG: hypothetical protein ABI650_06645 [Dokdonella sp.]
MKWFGLIQGVVVLGTVAWLYLKHGWRAGYRIGPSGDVMIDHGGKPLAVREMRSRVGWPIMALIEIPATRHGFFSVRPQPRIRLSAEIEIGHGAFDDTFLIGNDSHRLADPLRVRGDLRSHFALLPSRLEHERAKLSHVASEDGHLGLEINVRWTGDRPHLYRAMLVWLVELERMLCSDAKGNPRKPGRDTEYRVSSSA